MMLVAAVRAFKITVLCCFGASFLWSWKNSAKRVITYRGLAVIDEKENIRLLEDGTLEVGRQADPQTCRYFVDVPTKPKFKLPINVSSLHYRLEDCSEMQLGSRIGEHFGHQLLAAAAGIPYTMTCGPDDGSNDDKEQILFPNHPHTWKGDSVLKYLEVRNYQLDAPTDLESRRWDPLSVCMHCYGLSWWCEMGPQLLDTRDQMRAIADRKIDSEDAVIHLRLGDIFQGRTGEGTGLLPFRAYLKLLKEASETKGKSIRSIGIVTQPFDKRFTRFHDRKWVKRSRMVAVEFVKFLLSEFPDASVSLHNHDESSITSRASFTRMMKARIAVICGSTNYCTYPVLANRDAIGFLFRNEKLSPWTKHSPSYYTNIRSWKSPRLANNFTHMLTDEELTHWLKNQEAVDIEEVIYDFPLFRSARS